MVIMIAIPILMYFTLKRSKSPAAISETGIEWCKAILQVLEETTYNAYIC